MTRILGLMAASALVGIASAEHTAYVNTFDSLDGVTTTPPASNPYLYDGGAWADLPYGASLGIMDVMMDPVNGINIDPPIDFTCGEFTVTLQWYSEAWIPGEITGFWLRVYSRRDDPNNPGEWIFSGAQNYFYEVEQSGPDGGPGWQTWTRPVDDYDETDSFGPFIDDQVYKFRIEVFSWITPYSFGISHFELVVPDCPEDLSGDDDVDLEDLGILLTHYGCQPIPPTPVYSTDGFEAYSLGDLPGQDGWVDDTTDPNYGMVQVVDDPTASGMGKVIALDPPGTTGGTWLGAERPVSPTPTERYVVIEWDQYRDGLGDNVWYADTAAFDGWWAMQWDQNHQASSYIYDFGVPLTEDQWQHVTYILDTVNAEATVIVDGEEFTGSTPMPDTVINGIAFELEPTTHEGEDGPMYIDNVVIGESPLVHGCSRDDGDYDGDGDVDLSDLARLLTAYGCTPP